VVVLVLVALVVVVVVPFGPEPFVLSSAAKKIKNYNIQDDNFACGSVWV
jgi:hypothetical protein